MPVRDRGDDELVGGGGALQRLQPLSHLVGVPDELRCSAVPDRFLLLLAQRRETSESGYGMAPSPDRTEATHAP